MASAITSTETTIDLSSGTNFGNTSGVYSDTNGGLAGGTFTIKIGDEIITYTTIGGDRITGAIRGVNSTTAATHAAGATVEFYQVYRVPLTEINKTHTSIGNTGIDSYTITSSTTPEVGATGSSVQVGGTTATATENALMDYFSTNIATMSLPKTTITTDALVTTGTSPSGSQSSYLNTRNDESINAVDFALNDNYELDRPYIIASAINETNELAGRKSLEVRLNMSSTDAALSPVIDTGRMGIVTVANRLDNIDSSSDVFPTTDFISSNENEGDSNAAIYLTKQISLAQSATSLKVIVDIHRPSTSDVKVLFKLLRIDSATEFDDLAFEFFNPDSPQGAGSPDTAVPPATNRGSFVEHIYSAGLTDEDSTGQLDEFLGFQIKIVMQGTNCAAPPRLKDLRILALAT